MPFFKWVSVVEHLNIRSRSLEDDNVSILYYSMNIQSGRKGDQPVKGTKYGLSRIVDEEKPSSVANSVSGDTRISGTSKVGTIGP